jgi:hypothetical protein
MMLSRRALTRLRVSMAAGAAGPFQPLLPVPPILPFSFQA